MKSNIIKWKFISRENCWEGTVKGAKSPELFIHGTLCVTDVRESRAAPASQIEMDLVKNYKIKGLSIDEAKQLAEDLVTGANFEKHEANRLAVEAESQRTVDLIKEAEDFIKQLKEKQK